MTDQEVLTELRSLQAKVKAGAEEATKAEQLALHEAIGVFEDATKIEVPS